MRKVIENGQISVSRAAPAVSLSSSPVSSGTAGSSSSSSPSSAEPVSVIARGSTLGDVVLFHPAAKSATATVTGDKPAEVWVFDGSACRTIISVAQRELYQRARVALLESPALAWLGCAKLDATAFDALLDSACFFDASTEERTSYATQRNRAPTTPAWEPAEDSKQTENTCGNGAEASETKQAGPLTVPTAHNKEKVLALALEGTLSTLKEDEAKALLVDADEGCGTTQAGSLLVFLPLPSIEDEQLRSIREAITAHFSLGVKA